MSNTIKIPRYEIDEFYNEDDWEEHTGDYEFIDSELVDKGRWTTSYYHIFLHKPTGKLYRFEYEEANTENCDADGYGTGHFVTGIEVEAVETISIVYRAVRGDHDKS